ncbi:MAG: hypothetical protein IPO81_00065 [Kouleothrix sp.]|nr:hypothetical protein [Kouleothrix sp.]
MEQPHSGIDDYGQNQYAYRRGDPRRYQVGLTRTVLPHAAESNEQFERRMDTMAQQILGLPGVDAVALHMDVASGAITRCTVTITEAPRHAPIVPDARPAGGRFGGRGVRGCGDRATR